ncbi:hypothetical protein C488_15407 [Natrinema pellirubrum DSM 15624]|uniref:Uncharacterized protein n=1 Tax=Natrinema pellirubrum (strain DSM 15624 / CIP 106293 / JCM 10476 / NCIMB 786 / 157) TaxID=797303 RepID=L0JS67_NATP1|nr:hypothetical protein [Natrinema pellirubrum]AGB34094.1 hypothetical protein Natpe_4401 [Natrinema pellirubrum DSM 15624]ELY72169.1 hypothetical protein C488_15407 [Natrinema pellirubrum DSM 15624]
MLVSIGLSTAALAGCTSNSSTSPSNNSTEDSSGLDTEDSDVFANVEMNGKNLEVEVTGESATEFINLVDPNGELFDQSRLEEDDTEASFEILGRYEDDLPTGEYELIALKSLESEDPLDSTTISIDAECRITDVFWAAENPDMDWDKNSPVWDEYAAVVIENKGTIPSLLTELQWKGAPAAKLGRDDTVSYHHEIRLPPGETTVYSFGQIYQTSGAGGSVDCSRLGTEPMTVTAVVQVGPDPSYTQQIEYGDDQSCDLTIVKGSPTDSDSTSGEN